MKKLNKKTLDLTTLKGRLLLCMEKVGGKRALADKTQISEAQLFRYVNGISDMPGERYKAIAKVSNVTPTWLLTGEELIEATKKQRPAFRPALMQFTARLLDELLVEYQRTFPPRLKSSLLTLIYESLRHEECLHGTDEFPNKSKMLTILTFMEAMKTEEMMELYHKVMALLEYETAISKEHYQLVNAFCGLITNGYRNVYDAFPGEAYYERMGYDLSSEASTDLNANLALAIDTFGVSNLKILDLGCGNGRHLVYLRKQFPALSLHGIDSSKRAIELCDKLEASGKLDKSCVTLGECCAIPFESGTLNAIHARHVLHYLPYIPGTGFGIEAAFAEMHRVLARKGLIFLTHYAGYGREYSTFEQLMTPETTKALAESQGFKCIQINENGRLTDNKGLRIQEFSPPHQNVIKSILQKI